MIKIAAIHLISLFFICSLSPHLLALPSSDGIKKLTILHTNDHHGHFWHNSHGEFGMAARATLINKIREEVHKEGGSILLLSGGDINTGTPESDMQDAEPDFVGMNLLGYDAMAVGNHEFDNPLPVLLKQEKLANFPFLAANIYKDGRRLFRPYVVFKKNGVVIAVMGMTTEETASIGSPEFVKGIEFRDAKVEARNVIAELKQTVRPDIIIATTHMGHYANLENQSYETGDVALARFLDKGDLDLIVGGHSQEPVCMVGDDEVEQNHKPGERCTPNKQNGTYIVQAHDWGKYVGRADFEFMDGVLTLVNYQLIPVNLKHTIKLLGKNKRVFFQEEIEKDPVVFKTLEPYKKKGQETLDAVIGESNGRLIGERNIIRFQQTNLGGLIATSQMKKVNADFGIVNSGGIRASIEEGDITYRDVLTVQPFTDTIAVVEMTGEEVIEYLNIVANIPPGTGGYAQYSNISMDVSKDGVTNIKIAGRKLQLDRSYRLSIPAYIASGANNYPRLTNHKNYMNSGYTDADALKQYIQKLKTINVNSFKPLKNIRYQ